MYKEKIRVVFEKECQKVIIYEKYIRYSTGTIYLKMLKYKKM